MYIAACEKSADRSMVPETPRKILRMHHLSYGHSTPHNIRHLHNTINDTYQLLFLKQSQKEEILFPPIFPE